MKGSHFMSVLIIIFIFRYSMSRLVPWRNKPTSLILEMIPAAKEYKLYLVNESGPTSFIFKDDNDNKFKVTIGLQLSCSCGVVQNDHCIHTLYVLLKKYQVDQKNPIIWQASYLDSELEGMIQMKYKPKKKDIPTHKFIKKRITDNINNPVKEQEDDFPDIQGDQTCPICYQELKGQCYSACKQCHNCIHTKCLKIWTKHKQETGNPVTCPMCRTQFVNPMHTILKDQQRWANKFLIHKGTKCSGCGVRNIKGFIFHCLICENLNLCKLCFQSGQHPEHQKYFMKENANDAWVPGFPRNLLKNKLPVYKTTHEKTEDQFQTMLQNTKPLSNINQYLINLFPTVRQSYNVPTFNDIQSLNVVGNEVQLKKICYKCNKPGTQTMRKLYCGHTVHEECLLEKMIIAKEYECEVDGQVIFKGYLSAIGIKPKKRIKQNMVDVVLLRNEEQKKKIIIRRESADTKKPNLKTHQVNQLESMPLALNSAISNKTNLNNRITKVDNSLRAFRIKKNINEKKLEIVQQNRLQLMNGPMMITGIQQQQGRGRSVFK